MIREIKRFLGNLSGKKKFFFFFALFLVCIVALCIGIYTQYFYRYSETDPLMIGINTGKEKSIEEIANLKAEFNNLFQNSIKGDTNSISAEKNTISNDWVIAAYQLSDSDDNYYSVNVSVPAINIKTDVANEINGNIKTDFYDKANSIIRQTDEYIVYNVRYEAFINKGIISIVVKSSLKEGSKAEKVSIKTYNYNVSEKKAVSLKEMLDLKQVSEISAQKIIDSEIKTAATNAKILAADFGNLYERDLNSNIYKLENSSVYFFTDDGFIYVIYAYGNNDYTNEMDLVII